MWRTTAGPSLPASAAGAGVTTTVDLVSLAASAPAVSSVGIGGRAALEPASAAGARSAVLSPPASLAVSVLVATTEMDRVAEVGDRARAEPASSARPAAVTRRVFANRV